MGRKYANPPLIEALCEFQFEPDTKWDATVLGLVYERVRGQFPTRRPARQYSVSISPGPEGVKPTVQATERMQFLREDGVAMVQVGPHLLAVNHLKPYPSWERFLPLIHEGLKAYTDVASPTSIRRIGLRYINRIVIPSARIDPQDYFDLYPYVGPGLPQLRGPFMVGVQFPYAQSRDGLKLELISADSDRPDSSTLILNLDYFVAQPGAVALDRVAEWIESAHSHVEEAFEATIKDRLRQLFEEASA